MSLQLKTKKLLKPAIQWGAEHSRTLTTKKSDKSPTLTSWKGIWKKQTLIQTKEPNLTLKTFNKKLMTEENILTLRENLSPQTNIETYCLTQFKGEWNKHYLQ